MTSLTTGIIEDPDPSQWMRHRYGLAEMRWERLRNGAFWITGAGTGFGCAIATALASSGAHVFLTGRREAKLKEAIESMHSFGIDTSRCHAVPADVTNSEQIERAFADIRTRCSSLQGVVHSAAVPQRTRFQYPLEDEDVDCWDEAMQVNVRGPWLVTRTALPLMLKVGAARVLFLTSGAGWAFASGYGQYNVSKAALNSLTASFAEESSNRHPSADIQINGLDPGQARTEMNQGSTRSPFGVVSVALLLLSHPKGGPNGKFFSHDGRHLGFCNSAPYDKSLHYLVGSQAPFP